MAGKATPKKQNHRADPISQKGKEAKPAKAKDPKDSHLYTDDNPETTLQGTGFKDAATANSTSEYGWALPERCPPPESSGPSE